MADNINEQPVVYSKNKVEKKKKTEKASKAEETAKADASEKASKKAAKATNANKKPNIFSRMSKFFKECRSEFKKLVWPSQQQLFKNSSVVIVTMVVVGAVLSLVDFGLGQGLYALKDLIDYIKPVG